MPVAHRVFKCHTRHYFVTTLLHCNYIITLVPDGSAAETVTNPKLTNPIPGSFATWLTNGVGVGPQPTVTVEMEVETTVTVEPPLVAATIELPATDVLVGATIDILEVSAVATALDTELGGTRSYAWRRP